MSLGQIIKMLATNITKKRRNTKFKYVNEKISNANDQKQIWSEIKNLVLKKFKKCDTVCDI